MKITHYCNSFLTVTAGKTTLACDPWIGLEENNAWATYPIHKDNADLLNRIRPDAIYISHLHFDHFDRKTLSALDNKGTRFIVKAFKDHRLAARIRDLGFTNVEEWDPWTEVRISPDLSVSIVPQDVNNISGFDADINYDLDTSLVARDLKTNEVFYNCVDNPLSVSGFGKIRDYVRDEFKAGVDICCVSVGAASAFPQCFPTLDRAKESRRIVDESLKNFKNRMEALRPGAYFFAGGSYIIYGKFSCLNRYIAQPSADELRRYIADNLDMKYLEVDGGQSVEKVDGDWAVSDDFTGKRFASKAEAIREYRDMPYDYWVGDYSLADIDRLFPAATEKYFKTLDRLGVDMRWVVDFHVYDDLQLTDDGQIRPECAVLKTYRLAPRKPGGEIIQNHACHLDAILFQRLLGGQHIWNQSTAGSHIIYVREPNVFYPDVTDALNFLRA